MTQNRGILIVDDDDDNRGSLVKGLEQSGDYGVVAGAASGNEAIEILRKNPSKFHFAVVDHWLEGEPDGIETTKRLVKIAPQIYPVVFSNIPADNDPKVMEYKYRALDAGAYRYLGQTQDDRRKGIENYVEEIEQLVSLRDWISEFFLARAAAPSLLTQLDVGMDIIDRHYKVWFMNQAMRRIVGVPGPDLPKRPCAHWHGYECYPCRGCLVEKTLHDSESHSAFFLSPFPSRDKDRVFFLKVWSQPVTDPQGNVVLAKDGKPLAVMESVQDLTNSRELKAMPLPERLKIIAEALVGIMKEPFNSAKRFQYSRVYVVDRTGGNERFILNAAAGNPNPNQLNMTIELRRFDAVNLKMAEDNAKDTGCGYVFLQPSGFDPAIPIRKRTPYIYCPIIKNNQTIALVEVGNSDIKQETAELLKPYAREVLNAIEDVQQGVPTHIGIVATYVAEVERELQLKTSPEDHLKIIVKNICRLTESHQYIMRYVEGDKAILLRLKVPDLCGYEDVARPETPLAHLPSWSCRTISAQVESLADIVHDREVIEEFRGYLNDRSRKVLETANGLCYEPGCAT